ncbi:MAG: tetratricopeptide repeat protein [Deltaproteobacteria bacterium]|nr:tetratricopeptide repeat protein [Deltaproteobacteria bacterium]
MEQISLFEEEFMLLNEASAALMALRPGTVLELLERYRALYPGGQNVETKVRIASFLQQGFAATPPGAPDRPSYLFGLWGSFERYCRSLAPGGATADDFLRPFFRKIADAIEQGMLTDGDFLAEGIPVGYAHLQIGDYDRAIHSLQTALTITPANAATYGYLGDAYLMRGDREAARQIYFEACLIGDRAETVFAFVRP